MQLREPTRFKATRRRLTLLAVAAPAFAVAAAVCWSFQQQPVAIGCLVLSIVFAILLPGPLLRGYRNPAKEVVQVESRTDLIRALAMVILFTWLQSQPEFAALLDRIFHRKLWDPLLLLGASLWAIASAYRNTVIIHSLSDRQIFRYLEGEPARYDAGQTFRRIDSGD